MTGEEMEKTRTNFMNFVEGKKRPRSSTITTEEPSSKFLLPKRKRGRPRSKSLNLQKKKNPLSMEFPVVPLGEKFLLPKKVWTRVPTAKAKEKARRRSKSEEE